MDALLLAPGEGERIADRAERSVVIKLGLEQLALTDSRYATGESGPGPHVHREHADCFWVLDGELLFELGLDGERVRAAAGAFVLVPPHVVHTFRNEREADARFLNLHAPSKGFDDHLRALRDGDESSAERFDTFDPPADGGAPASEVVVRRAGEGDRVALGGSGVLFKAEGSDGIGSLSLTETTLASGFPGPVPHRHHVLVDSFYVLDGTLTLRLGDDLVEAGPGTYAAVPPGNVHTFSNWTAEQVRMLNVMAPGGFERYLKEVAAAMPPGGAPDPQAMASIASRYDFEPA